MHYGFFTSMKENTTLFIDIIGIRKLKLTLECQQYVWISKIKIFKYSAIFIKFNDEMGVAMKMTM